ncbi:MAG TPA: KEOPS complex subunit Pcc1 [Candidatus Woesearchaeota archaeon]|nr:KEOPS complex subunit Pcc1 [Candidatus Woesearchaeota archaeon]
MVERFYLSQELEIQQLRLYNVIILKMITKATITVFDDVDEIVKIFEPEDKVLTNNRGSYVIRKEEDKVVFCIEAKDSSALRALLNSISKNLIICEKAREKP